MTLMYLLSALGCHLSTRVSYKIETMSTDREPAAPPAHPAPIRFMTLHELRREGAASTGGGRSPARARPRLVLRTLRA
jgi:hypothetical protein